MTVVGNNTLAGLPALGAPASAAKFAGALNGATGLFNIDDLVAYAGTKLSGPAWTAYTPAVGSGTGTITTASAAGRFYISGKNCFFTVTVTITTNGSGATSVTTGLPATSKSAMVFTGGETATSGKILQARTPAISNGLTIINYDNTYPGANGAVLTIDGSFETI